VSLYNAITEGQTDKLVAYMKAILDEESMAVAQSSLVAA